MTFLLHAFMVLLANFCAMEIAAADAIRISATSYEKAYFTRAEFESEVLRAGNLGGITNGKEPKSTITGRVEYKFNITTPGWYEFTVETDHQGVNNHYGYEHEYILDDTRYLNGAGYDSAPVEGDFKIANIWLDAGSHTIAISRFYWTGFHPIRALVLSPSDNVFSKTANMAYADNEFWGGPFVRRGESVRIFVESAGIYKNKIYACLVYKDGRRVYSKKQLNLPQINGVTHSTVIFDTAELRDGTYEIRFYDGDKLVSSRDIRWLKFSVIDTSEPVVKSDQLTKMALTRGHIDCSNPSVSRYQDITSEPPRIEQSRGVRYRASGDTGFLQHMNPVDPSWFSFPIAIDRQAAILPGFRKPYLFEIDYPENAWRSFVISIRDQNQFDITLSSGVDMGGEFELSGAMQTHTLWYWPRNDGEPRIVFLNARDRSRAVCAEIRTYQVTNEMMPPLVKSTNGRHFGYWFEEHDRWAEIFGAANKTREEYQVAAERWMQTARYLGVDTLFISAKVYAYSLFPSRRFNVTDTHAYTSDIVQMFLLLAEKYHMRLVVEMEPRANELMWDYPLDTSNKKNQDNLLIHRSGHNRFTIPVGTADVTGSRSQQPLFDPSHPRNKQWYRGMIGEIVQRYREYPAFAGVSLRAMPFESPSLNNFHSLDWGYGDATLKEFKNTTGIDVLDIPVSQRYEILTQRYRDKWIDWRSNTIYEIVKDIADDTSKQRSDANIFMHIFNGPHFPIDTPREAGLDPARLGTIKNLVLINALTGYGRTSRDTSENGAKREDWRRNFDLMDSTWVGALLKDNRATNRNAFNLWGYYAEDGGQTVPPQSIGLPVRKSPVWTSAQMQPGGRFSLQRYALTLAQSDAPMLMNGGNGYFLDQPVVRDFMSVYRQLPPHPFTKIDTRGQAVAVRYATVENKLWCYMVNQLPTNATLSFSLSNNNDVQWLGSNATENRNKGTMTVKFRPFQLIAFVTTIDNVIGDVTSEIDKDQAALYEKEFAMLDEHLSRIKNNKSATSINDRDMATARELLTQGQAYLKRGAYWDVYRVLHHPALTVVRFP